MTERIIRTASTVLVLSGVTLALGGCETWKGLGKDVEHVGESMQGDRDDANEEDRAEGDG